MASTCRPCCRSRRAGSCSATAGAPADLFDVLADDGVNTVRVRVWNDPFDASGRGYGGGNVDVARAVEIGQRATAAGLSVLVDFHYSDFWADPARQLAPKAWAGLSDAETVTALHDFTADALQSFEDAGVDVAWCRSATRRTTRSPDTRARAARSTPSSPRSSRRAAPRCARCCPTHSSRCTSRTPRHPAATRRMPRDSRVRRRLRRVRELVLPVLARHDRESDDGAQRHRDDIRQAGHGRRDVVGAHSRRRRRVRQRHRGERHHRPVPGERAGPGDASCAT